MIHPRRNLGKDLEVEPTEKGYLLASSLAHAQIAFIYILQPHIPRNGATHSGWGLPHQLSIKAISRRHGLRPILQLRLPQLTLVCVRLPAETNQETEGRHHIGYAVQDQTQGLMHVSQMPYQLSRIPSSEGLISLRCLETIEQVHLPNFPGN